jgi:hypothetical protein
MEREALKLALEALDMERLHYLAHESGNDAPEYILEAIASCEQALAQPAQGPASVTYKEAQDSMNALEKGTLYQQVIAEELGQRKLYTTPPAAQPAQEENGITNYAHSLMVKCFNEEYDKHLDKNK